MTVRLNILVFKKKSIFSLDEINARSPVMVSNRLPAVLVCLWFFTTFVSPGLLNPLNAPPIGCFQLSAWSFYSALHNFKVPYYIIWLKEINKQINQILFNHKMLIGSWFRKRIRISLLKGSSGSFICQIDLEVT